MVCFAMHLMLFKQLFVLLKRIHHSGLLFLTCYFAAATTGNRGFPRPGTGWLLFFPRIIRRRTRTRGAPKWFGAGLQASSCCNSLRRRGRPGRCGVERASDLRERYPVWANLANPNHGRVVFGPAMRRACAPRPENVTRVAYAEMAELQLSATETALEN